MAKHKDRREIYIVKIKPKISREESVAIESFSHQEGMVRKFAPCVLHKRATVPLAKIGTVAFHCKKKTFPWLCTSVSLDFWSISSLIPCFILPKYLLHFWHARSDPKSGKIIKTSQKMINIKN